MSRYLHEHAQPAGPGDARPTAQKVLYDLQLLGKCHHMYAIVTGGTAGIGLQMVAALHAASVNVMLGAITVAEGEAAIQNIKREQAELECAGVLKCLPLDLSKLDSVREFARLALASLPQQQLHLLFNHAGALCCWCCWCYCHGLCCLASVWVCARGRP